MSWRWRWDSSSGRRCFSSDSQDSPFSSSWTMCNDVVFVYGADATLRLIVGLGAEPR